ncbi:MAG: glycerophosphodiester phosphodiesterase [Rhodoferax sp.]|nr:glycerophosphodiester phosphodiesterase [Rhodoferax sp.]
MKTAPSPAQAAAHPTPWPYPRWIAHRGAGTLAPENTLSAFRLGASHGYRMFECDIKLSSDGVPFLLHDDTLARTVDLSALPRSADPVAGQHPWHTLSQLDAGRWHSATFAGEPLPTLEAVARFCIANGYFLNIEIKPTVGTERLTGEVVAQHAARLWQGVEVPPLLTSFDIAALEGAFAAKPELPRGLLIHALDGQSWAQWLGHATRLGCQAIVCNHELWAIESVALAKAAGFRLLSYTVNDPQEAQRLLDLGTDGVITDRVDIFSPTA